MTTPQAKVRRGGETVVVPAAEVVPGDVLLLESGDLVAADARVIEAALRRYAAVIHLRTPLQAHGIDHSNPLGVESAQQAAILDQRIAAAWSPHPRRFEVPSTTDFVDKARMVLEPLRDELPACCRGHEIELPRD